MTATSIPIGLTLDTVLTVAQTNAYGKTFAAMGITDDNLGLPQFARSMPFLTPMRVGDMALAPLQLVAPRTYTVKAGQVFIATVYNGDASLTIIPSGRSTMNTLLAGQTSSLSLINLHLPFAAGDKILLGTPLATDITYPVLSGFTATADAHVTPFLMNLALDGPYTVPANKALLITCCINSTLTVDGASCGLPLTDFQDATAGKYPSTQQPLMWLKAGQVLGAMGSVGGYLLS